MYHFIIVISFYYYICYTVCYTLFFFEDLLNLSNIYLISFVSWNSSGMVLIFMVIVFLVPQKPFIYLEKTRTSDRSCYRIDKS